MGLPPVSETDIYRFRYHHGVNIGSCFVLEKWIHPSMYPQDAASSELAAVSAAVMRDGPDHTRMDWEQHWAGAVSDSDLNWLSNIAHCTSIRLPIGYFTLGPDFCQDTPFNQFSSIYANAWSAVKTLISRAHNHGIGVLIDFHALPGGANDQDHSGTNSGKAELWQNNYFLDLTVKCLVAIAEEIAAGAVGPNVIGLQLCNEATCNAPGLYPFYDRCVTAISQVDSSLPIFISDAWEFRRAVEYARSHNTLRNLNSNPVVVDIHNYWCFSNDDKAKSPQQLIADVPSKLSAMDGLTGSVVDHGAAQVIIGEYSCVIDQSSWDKANNAPRNTILKQFGNIQSQTWQKHAGGSFFWTLKMDWMPGGDWGFVAQTMAGNITPPPQSLLTKSTIDAKVTRADNIRDRLRTADIQTHVKYWHDKSPSTQFEHKKYADGWDTGFADARAFFMWRTGFGGTPVAGKNVGADKIGNLELWILKRLGQAGMGGERFAWEWEAGFRKAVGGFDDAVAVDD